MIDFAAGWLFVKTWANKALKGVDLTPIWASAKTTIVEALANRPKLSIWLAISVAATAAVLFVAPEMAGPALYKFAVTGVSVVWLYWLSRHIWPHSRPSSFLDADGKVLPGQEIPFAAALLAQALFIAISFHGLAGLV